ncbi:hypothetical protein SK128_025824, partial [Halocaridina rubra]
MGCSISREYEVRLPSRRVWWRNRRHLCPVPSPSDGPFLHVPMAPCSALQSPVNNSPHCPTPFTLTHGEENLLIM